MEKHRPRKRLYFTCKLNSAMQSVEIMAYHQTITKHMLKINQDWHAKLVPSDHKHNAKVVQRRLDYCEELNSAQIFREYRNTTHITFLAKVTNHLPDKWLGYSWLNWSSIFHKICIKSCHALFSFHIFNSIWIHPFLILISLLHTITPWPLKLPWNAYIKWAWHNKAQTVFIQFWYVQ